MSNRRPYSTRERFEADEIRDGDPYELSGGYKIHGLPTGGRGSQATQVGAAVLASDPAVESVGIDTGFTPAPDTLRAPDIAVGNVPSEPGWVKGVPPLAVEYADTGQDEADLAVKLRELLAAGTRFIWVVRLVGPRRVEIHEAGRQEMRIAHPGDQLEAPGVLRNPVPVEALYDWKVGQEVTLRNLLQRRGYDSLRAIQDEGETRGEVLGELTALRSSIRDIFAERRLEVGEDVSAAIAGCEATATLKRWLRLAVTTDSPNTLLGSDR